ncbi:dehydrogenase [Streptomyces mirabilis]
MTDAQHYDVIVVGTGAGGGTIAHRPAPTGKRILLLERGDCLPRERDNWDSTAVFVKGKYRAPEFWFDKHGNQFPPEVNYYVGGKTKFYGAALFRMRPEDFGELRHHDGISPAWPLSYEELEPYYTQAEHLYLVHGRHGEDPTEGPTSAQYAYPPAQHEPRIEQLSHDLEKQGLHPFHLPIGVNLTQDDRGRATHTSACIRCDRVDGFPCLVGAKADVQVVVACGAVNSAVLLLRSANDRHPRGLANCSDVVGRHYMRHNNLALMAVSKEPNDTRFQKTLALHDWYLGSDDWEFPLGGIQMLGNSDSEQIHGEAPRWAGAVSPDMPFEVLAHHAVDFWLWGEDLPAPDNRVTLDRDGGIHLALDEKNNIAGLNHLRHKLQGMLSHLGMHEHHLLSRNTSFFPSIGAVNPSLTAIANALRVGDRIADRLR